MALHGRGHPSSKPGGCVFLVKSDQSPGSWEVTTRISSLHTCSEVITYTHMVSPSPEGGLPRRLNELNKKQTYTHRHMLMHGWGRGKQPRSSKMPNPKHQPGESAAGRERQTDRKTYNTRTKLSHKFARRNKPRSHPYTHSSENHVRRQ